ncbi:MAG: hypothetical protein HDR75_02070 [Bacteroides sp.]|nr:hypothetical protein [Bacteroides sp.]
MVFAAEWYATAFVSPDEQKQAILGTYLVDVSSMFGGIDDIYQYGKYVVNDDTIRPYSWDDRKKIWVKNLTVPYQLIYQYSDDYMTGYNIVFKNPSGYEVHICTGDVNDDGKIDIWSSDLVIPYRSAKKALGITHSPLSFWRGDAQAAGAA